MKFISLLSLFTILSGISAFPVTFLESAPIPYEVDFNTISINYKKILGSGTYADVYEASVTCDGMTECKTYAAKVFKVQDKDIAKVALREKEILDKILQLDLPHTVKIRFAGPLRQNSYVLGFDLYKSSLSKYMETNKYNMGSKVTRAKIADQLVKGLTALHAAGIGHFDIKPDNILLDAKNNVFIGDFGFAKTKGTPIVGFYGSERYLAPEILKREKYDEKVDIWAMGLTIYELFEGRYAFFFANSMDELLPQIENRLNGVNFDDWKFLIKGGNVDYFNMVLNEMLEIDPHKRPSMEQITRKYYGSKTFLIREVSQQRKVLDERFCRFATSQGRCY